jgi:ubiquitin-protein ligase
MDDQLISRNTQCLDRYNGVSIKKRLKKEIDKMYPNHAQIDVEINENGKIEVTVFDILDDKLQKYGFIITDNYPFTAPKIFFQSRPYIEFLKMTNYHLKLSGIFKKVTKKDCFCCTSINCSDNWSPGLTLEKIIAEILQIKKQKRDLVNKIIADKIKLRYLIDDIDLDSWLF